MASYCCLSMHVVKFWVAVWLGFDNSRVFMNVRQLHYCDRVIYIVCSQFSPGDVVAK